MLKKHKEEDQYKKLLDGEEGFLMIDVIDSVVEEEKMEGCEQVEEYAEASTLEQHETCNRNAFELLQLVDRSTKHLKDYETNEEVPIILGQPFLATGGAVIEVPNGELTMRVNGEQVTFNVFQAMRFPNGEERCSQIDVIDSLVAKAGLEECLPEEQGEEYAIALDLELLEICNKVTFESLKTTGQEFQIPKSSIVNPPKLELKQLFFHLKYVHLGELDTLQVFVFSNLGAEHEVMLIFVLQQLNLNLKEAWTSKMLQLNEFDELRLLLYDNAKEEFGGAFSREKANTTLVDACV